MNYLTRYHKALAYTRMKTEAMIVILALFLLPGFTPWKGGQENVFEVMVSGQTVGRLRNPDQAREILRQARLNAAKDSEGILLTDPSLYVEGRVDDFAHFTDPEEMTRNIEQVLKDSAIRTDEPAYSVKVGQTMVNVKTLDNARDVLQAAIDVYQEKEDFKVQLVPDSDRQINVLTADTVSAETAARDEKAVLTVGSGEGIDPEDTDGISGGVGFDAFDYGLKDLRFAGKVEVVESYLSEDQLSDADTAL